MVEDKIKHIGKYWDDKIELDIVARTINNKLIVANCKYTNNKIKKSELSKLNQDCDILGISPDIIILFSKNGFTSELKSLKSENLKLFTAKHLKLLLNIQGTIPN